MSKTAEAILWGIFILVLSASMIGCAQMKEFTKPNQCHPDRLIPDGDGGFFFVYDPCGRRR